MAVRSVRPSPRRSNRLLPARALVACALLSAGAAARGDGSDGGSGAPTVLRIHSLGGLVEHAGFEGGTLSLLPYRAGGKGVETFDEAYGNDKLERGASSTIGAEDVVALIRNVVDSELWEGGTARLDLADESRLVVTAPAETQERIAGLLSGLVAAIAPATTLQVAVLRGTPAADVPAVVDAKTADALDVQLEVVRRVQFALAGRNSATASSFLSGSGVFDWDVEIAQGAVIGDPILAAIRAGIEVVARAVPTDGGNDLALLVREAEPEADPSVRTLDGRGAVVAQQVVNERAAAGVVHHPRLGFLSYAGTCFVPNGRALLLPVSVQTHLGPVAFTLDLRIGGDAAPARVSLDLKSAGETRTNKLGFVSFGLAALGRIEFERLPARLFDSGWGLMDEPVWTASLTLEKSVDRAVDIANSIAGPALEAGTGSVTPWGNYLLTMLPADATGDVADAIAAFERRGGGEISGRIVSGATEIGRFRVPYFDDHPLELWSGVQGTRVADWDVDVANEAFIPNPQMETWVDGFALVLRVARDARGRAVVHANGVLNFLDGAPQKTELGDANHLAIETIRARRCSFDEVRALPEGKTPRAAFGSSDLALELELKPR